MGGKGLEVSPDTGIVMQPINQEEGHSAGPADLVGAAGTDLDHGVTPGAIEVLFQPGAGRAAAGNAGVLRSDSAIISVNGIDPRLFS